MRNALTFDVEEYFHVEAFKDIIETDRWASLESRVVASTHRVLDLLEARHVSATFFVLGWVADRHRALVREIQSRGHEVACHSYAHQVIYTMDREAFRADVRRAKQALEDATGATVLGYRAPTFSVVEQTLWALEVLAEEGFRYDSSIFPIRHDRYGMSQAPRFPHRVSLPSGGRIVEFPVSTMRVVGQNVPFSGGGYFRVAPYPLVRAALRHVNRRDRLAAMVYLHPWEMDPEQPRFPVGAVARVRHYANLGQTAAKLDRLLQDFSFAPACQVLGEQGFWEVTA